MSILDNKRSTLEKSAWFISVLGGFLLIIFGFVIMFELFNLGFVAHSFFISSNLLAGLSDIFSGIVVLLIELEVLKIDVLNNYLYRSLLYCLIAFVFSMCGTIAIAGLLYFILYFRK